jgi:hypothetical protein
MDEKRLKSATKLLDAAYEFWNSCHLEGQYGAVQWLIGSNGELILFTRGEYKNKILNNVFELNSTEKVHTFISESIKMNDRD